MSPVAEVVVVYDVTCPQCSRIARELPDVLTVPVRVRSCRDPHVADAFPSLPAAVRRCAAPAVGVVRDGSVRWWRGRRGAIGLLPVLRRSPRAVSAAVGLWFAAARAGRA
ncbi:MAG TPA: hypothetical protein VM367_18495 [Pseudonocardia sp.]|nr:hypothetical protein [Pseudonocardia sp.]